MILPGSASQSLGAALADELDEPLAVVETQRFADGEFKVRVPDAGGERAVVVAATVSAEAHLELLQLQDLARAHFEEVVTVLPYMGYARQDRAFRDGEPVSARAVARAVSTGTDRVLAVNPHEPSIAEFFDVPFEVVDAAARLAEPLPDLADPLFLAPDEGAIGIAETVCDAYGAGSCDHFEKTRDYDTGDVTVEPAGADPDGREVVLVDDIVATGSTMSAAIARLHERGVADVYVTCLHPMFADNARAKLADAGVAGVWGTDTIERPVSDVSVAPTLAERL
ncbi:ribose-phosphate diphosphokinase [Halosegnis marinus]|uniref:Ribose-phosphate pyrophosphokinase n=1 Tax=Halosegnis marinus TaxID=3034023 RepID=A0ABD5ZNW9_9EURY|nr:ribose-phosphate diphosphokinase [Halosegnis sp. DT85]